MFLPGIGQSFATQGRKSPRNTLACRSWRDHLVDKSLFGGNKGIGETVFVILGSRRDLVLEQ